MQTDEISRHCQIHYTLRFVGYVTRNPFLGLLLPSSLVQGCHIQNLKFAQGCRHLWSGLAMREEGGRRPRNGFRVTYPTKSQRVMDLAMAAYLVCYLKPLNSEEKRCLDYFPTPFDAFTINRDYRAENRRRIQTNWESIHSKKLQLPYSPGKCNRNRYERVTVTRCSYVTRFKKQPAGKEDRNVLHVHVLACCSDLLQNVNIQPPLPPYQGVLHAEFPRRHILKY